MAVFERSPVLVKISFTVRNDGNSPTLLTLLPFSISDERLSFPPDWTRTTKDLALIGGATHAVEYRMEGSGEMFREWSRVRKQVTLEFETRSPVSSVVDVHKWVGTFDELRFTGPPGSAKYDLSNEGFTGPSAAVLARKWPNDLI
jgi:hypothetical protein